MTLKKLLSLILISFTTFAFAVEPATTTVKVYGYVGNDFFYNSRQNMEMVDGIIQLFPKTVSLNASNQDINGTAQAEMLSVNTRLGVDITGTPILGAKSSGKIEADFAGFGTSFYVFRIRQAYMKLNWNKTELLVGQTWHPLFGTVAPSTFSANGGAPFQPFNRSPQVRVKQNLTKTLSATAAALYEMQYASFGSLGTAASNIYEKNAIIPDLFVGLENKTTHWTTGAGIDCKTLKLTTSKVTSTSAVAYGQYTNNKFTAKAKAIYGQNLSDQLMVGGYGISAINGTDTTYTNINTASGWLNIVYGTKIQIGILGGYSQNLGTNDDLCLNTAGKYTIYGYGSSTKPQSMMNKLYRIAPAVSYNLPNLKFGIEYDMTTATYGTLKNDGLVSTPQNVTNHRILASVMYIF